MVYILVQPISHFSFTQTSSWIKCCLLSESLNSFLSDRMKSVIIKNVYLQLIKYLPELLEPLFFMLDDTRKEEFFFSLPLSFYCFTYSFLSTWIKMRLAISVGKPLLLITNQCCDPGCLSRIPDPTFFHPGSRIRTVSIPDPHQRI
jgi:hypothetical protein